MTLGNPQLLQRPLDRTEYLQVVQTSLAAGQYLFARQCVLSWLTAYPGDLRAGLNFARALAGEGRNSQALQILQGLCTADPEFIEAVETSLEVLESLKKSLNDADRGDVTGMGGLARWEELESNIKAHWFALKGRNREGWQPASWGGPLWFARQAIAQGDLRLAEELIEEVWRQGPAHPLSGVTHLQFMGLNPKIAIETKLELAKSYQQRWPNTQHCMLLLADWSLESGQSDFAVALLHQAAARDVEGQVATRLWGKEHAYRSLWPGRMQLAINQMIPAEVMARLGWNRLPQGTSENSVKDEPQPERSFVKPFTEPTISETTQLPVEAVSELAPSDPVLHELKNDALGIESELSTEPELELHPKIKRRSRSKSQAVDQEMNAVRQEFEKLAKKLNLNGIMRQDGRFPVYVILSFRNRLQSVYGPKIAGLLESEMQLLGDAVSSRPGWGSRIIFADDPSCTSTIGAKPVKYDDPWGLKLLLADLDDALEYQGERIGALFILGGPEIVPFHHLPNPMNDPDTDVPSDNPYSTRDENYFIPEWPVGRLPGGAGSDARMLLTCLRRYQAQHRSLKRKQSWRERLKDWIVNLFANFKPEYQRNFAYTAEVWRKAAAAVFSPIGRSKWMHESPPAGLTSEEQQGQPKKSSELSGVPKPAGKLGYFNLHGLVDATEWFGHRDFQRPSNQPDFPVALRPQDIPVGDNSSTFPGVIFSEACYGMHIHDRALDEAIALKFLEAGSLAVVGSTCMAYGSISAAPMVAADLLGYTFWRFLVQGMPAGEALRQAKIYLATEMQHRQGYLDGEDQKTLISFNLYGDPLAEPLQKERDPKIVRYQSKPVAEMRTISDNLDDCVDSGPVPAEVMDGVRQAVAKYLPGMSDARVAYVCEPEPHETISAATADSGPGLVGESTRVLGSRPGRKGSNTDPSFRNLVTLSKQVARSGEIHPQIARLRLDEQGKLVKLVVSR
jgi:hypothetical protein